MMRLSLGFESSGSDIAINGGWGRGIGDEAWLSSVARWVFGLIVHVVPQKAGIIAKRRLELSDRVRPRQQLSDKTKSSHPSTHTNTQYTHPITPNTATLHSF